MKPETGLDPVSEDTGPAPRVGRLPAKAKKARTKKAKGANGKPKKQRVADPAKLDMFGFRKGSLKSKAAAMYAHKKGATLGEVEDELRSVQFNVLNELTEKGFKVTRSEHVGNTGRKITRFHVNVR